MNWWNLSIMLTLPHERFLFGWEFFNPDNTCDHYTFSLSLGIATISFDWGL